MKAISDNIVRGGGETLSYLVAAIFALAMALPTKAGLVARWDFNNYDPGNPTSAAILAPTVGDLAAIPCTGTSSFSEVTDGTLGSITVVDTGLSDGDYALSIPQGAHLKIPLPAGIVRDKSWMLRIRFYSPYSASERTRTLVSANMNTGGALWLISDKNLVQGAESLFGTDFEENKNTTENGGKQGNNGMTAFRLVSPDAWHSFTAHFGPNGAASTLDGYRSVARTGSSDIRGEFTGDGFLLCAGGSSQLTYIASVEVWDDSPIYHDTAGGAYIPSSSRTIFSGCSLEDLRDMYISVKGLGSWGDYSRVMSSWEHIVTTDGEGNVTDLKIDLRDKNGGGVILCDFTASGADVAGNTLRMQYGLGWPNPYFTTSGGFTSSANVRTAPTTYNGGGYAAYNIYALPFRPIDGNLNWSMQMGTGKFGNPVFSIVGGNPTLTFDAAPEADSITLDCGRGDGQAGVRFAYGSDAFKTMSGLGNLNVGYNVSLTLPVGVSIGGALAIESGAAVSFDAGGNSLDDGQTLFSAPDGITLPVGKTATEVCSVPGGMVALSPDGTALLFAAFSDGECVWNDGDSGASWKASGKWSKNDVAGDWSDGAAAVFENAGDEATVDSAVSAASVTFRADAAVGGASTLTVPFVAVSNGVSANISAPTAGALEKTGAGTLTLGASRTAQTTLSEGTLVMSGEGTTLDWTKFTFGTDPLRPVTLKFENGATFANISPMVAAAENMDITLVKECGDWNVTGNFQFPNTAGTTAKFFHKGGTLTASEYLVFGDNKDAKPTYAEISGGTVRCASTAVRAIIASPSDATVVVTNAGTLATAGDLLIANTAVNGTLTVEDGGTVDVAGDVVFGYSSADANGVVNLNGGTLSAKKLRRNTECSCALNFDGGTLKAKADGNLVDTTAIAVTVGANGGVIDANGKTIAFKSAISGTGGMTFKGGGTVTLASGNAYVGMTTVEVGTTVRFAAAGEIGSGLVVTFPDTTLADGVYTLVACDGAETFDASVLADIVAPANARLRFASDYKSVFCVYGNPPNTWIGGASGSLGEDSNWSLGYVPAAGETCFIGNATAASLTNPSDSAFAPTSIVFLEDSAAVTIDGEDAITGISAITNLSSASHTINVPVSFTGNIQVKQNADYYDHISGSHVTFAGGAYAGEGCSIETGSAVNWSRCMFGAYCLDNGESSRWTALQYASCRPAVADGSTLYVPYSGNLTELDVRSGAKVYVGDAVLGGGRLSHVNLGEMIVTNLTITGSDTGFLTYSQGTSKPGVFKFDSVTNAMTANWFFLGDGSAKSSHVCYIGAGGLNFKDDGGSAAYCIGRNTDGNSETIRPWYSDFAIGARSTAVYGLVFARDVTFCTDDESGTPRTITIDAITRGNDGSPAISVSGSGTLKVNNTCDNASEPTVTVKDTATLAFKPGASLGTGATTVKTGATLAVAESGTVTLGDLTLRDGAALAFNFTSRKTAPMLAVASVTAGGTVNVKISIADGSRPVGGTYTLTSGGGFGEAALALAAGTPDWVKEIGKDGEGNIVITVKARGTAVFIR